MATLDPIARYDFMALVLTAVADNGNSVVLSSHVPADLCLADLTVESGNGRRQDDRSRSSSLPGSPRAMHAAPNRSA